MWASFELERFERVVAVPGIALLRVSGRFRAEAVARLEPPGLLGDGGGGPRRIQALPGGDRSHADGPARWRGPVARWVPRPRARRQGRRRVSARRRGGGAH